MSNTNITFTPERFKQELMILTKNIVVDIPSKFGNNFETIYLYNPGGNDWITNFNTKILKNDNIHHYFERILQVNKNQLNEETANFLRSKIIATLWNAIFNKKLFLLTNNTSFIYVTFNADDIRIHTVKDSQKNIQNRPNTSEIILTER